jgi:small nuclear ribonucleoprotein (snRNP)-like protein
MCFNPAKSWQLGWYIDKRVTVDVLNDGPFNGTLVGVDDYLSAGDNEYVHIKVTKGSNHLYIGFNRNTGINSGTKEAGNQVIITQRNGGGYSTSTLKAKFGPGGIYRVGNYLGTGKSLLIKVVSIDTKAVIQISIPIFFDGFEGGFGKHFYDGGKKASINTKKKYEGKKSLRIAHNKASSKAYTKTYNVAQYSLLRVAFVYLSQRVENEEGFSLRYSANGGNWKLAKQFVKGTDWTGNGAWKTASVEIPASDINTIKLQFKGACNNARDVMYFDNVLFLGLNPEEESLTI